MRRCQKCSLTFADSAKICRSCGAILDDVVDEPSSHVQLTGCQRGQLESIAQQVLSATDPNPADQSGEQYSWTCSQCAEDVPGSFHICWNCGCDRQGVAHPSFAELRSEANSAKPQSEPPEPTERIARLRCDACGSSRVINSARIEAHEGSLIKIVIPADPDVAFDDRVWGAVTADVCGDCGRVQLRVKNADELYAHWPHSVKDDLEDCVD